MAHINSFNNSSGHRIEGSTINAIGGNQHNNRAGTQFNNNSNGPQNNNNGAGTQTNYHADGAQRIDNGYVGKVEGDFRKNEQNDLCDGGGGLAENPLEAGNHRENLPEDMKAAFYECFTPALIELAGCRAGRSGTWSEPTPQELKELWSQVMPSDIKNGFSAYERGIKPLVTKVLTDWRNSFGEAAIKALQDELDMLDVEPQEYINKQTKGNIWEHPCYYVQPEQRTGFLQTNIVAKTFSEHFKAIASIPVSERSGDPPKRAMVLAILAVTLFLLVYYLNRWAIFQIERAFRIFSTTTCIPPSGEFSSDSEAMKLAPRVFTFFEKNERGIDRVDSKLWGKIIAAAESHLEPTIDAGDWNEVRYKELPAFFS
ncbi:hypothetical protein D9758_016224 [Tetrapyrgos nigripes]|uniref:Uncharacterized protein n=1 Tax=Tetrapyrgos nigripes TaxID=182062 RepID=A0A8H5CLA6_9AGAR|nr:hypothetical protein D9758_016224 [Tetrapyrgos nigripes]